MTNRPFRPYDPAKDVKTVQRIWKEVGWIDDDKDESDALEDLLKTGNTEVATINGEAECLVHWTPGTVQYQEETLQLGAVAAVTTSHISRKLGFAKDLTARSLAHQFESGIEVSALGIFDQGFYNNLGYGTGPYENLVQFDPARIQKPALATLLKPHRPLVPQTPQQRRGDIGVIHGQFDLLTALKFARLARTLERQHTGPRRRR